MICKGLEKIDRKYCIKKLIDKGYCKDEATEYYNLWRKHYVHTLVNIT